MGILRLSIILSVTLLVSSCKNEAPNKVADTKASDKVKTLEVEQRTDLKRFGIDDKPGNVLGGLKVGDKAPDFTLKDSENKAINLYDLTSGGPAILTFYRAHWCGYCTKQLAEFQSELEGLSSDGISVLAISPELQKHARLMAKENHISFPILFDENHDVAKAYKVLFHVNQMYQDRLESAAQKSIAKVNGDLEAKMPIPATYVIGQDNTIKYVYYNPDYSQRAPMAEIKKTIKGL